MTGLYVLSHILCIKIHSNVQNWHKKNLEYMLSSSSYIWMEEIYLYVGKLLILSKSSSFQLQKMDNGVLSSKILMIYSHMS